MGSMENALCMGGDCRQQYECQHLTGAAVLSRDNILLSHPLYTTKTCTASGTAKCDKHKAKPSQDRPGQHTIQNVKIMCHSLCNVALQLELSDWLLRSKIHRKEFRRKGRRVA